MKMSRNGSQVLAIPMAQQPITPTATQKVKMGFLKLRVSASVPRIGLSTAVMTVWEHLHGAQIHRVHDVAECARALRLIRAAEPFVR